MPVMVIVAIIVPEHPPVIHTGGGGIDVGKTIPHDFSILGLPHFFFQLCATTGPLQKDRFVHDLLDGRFDCQFATQSLGYHRWGIQCPTCWALKTKPLSVAVQSSLKVVILGGQASGSPKRRLYNQFSQDSLMILRYRRFSRRLFGSNLKAL
jgi:hypothetical protein